MRIVRNLRIVNSSPSLPTRAWRNSTGRPSVAATARRDAGQQRRGHRRRDADRGQVEEPLAVPLVESAHPAVRVPDAASQVAGTPRRR